MTQFQDDKVDLAKSRTPLGLHSKFHSAIEDGDLVGIVFSYSAPDQDRHPYFYEIYDDKKLLGRGGGTDCTDPEKLTEIIKARLTAIHKTRLK